MLLITSQPTLVACQWQGGSKLIAALEWRLRKCYLCEGGVLANRREVARLLARAAAGPPVERFMCSFATVSCTLFFFG